MKTLLINPAWDAAGVSIRQAKAINKYTNWEARHFRHTPTFGYDTDIIPENYKVEEFIELVRSSDVIHFCSATPFYNTNNMNWGFDWKPELKNKLVVFHDYCSFPGHWRDRANAKDYWEAKTKIECDVIFSSIPQAVHIYKDCVYIPDIVDESEAPFQVNPNKPYDMIHLGHFSTGGGNNKNTDELRSAISRFGHKINLTIPASSSLMNRDVINLKQNVNLGFDALWREYHGMTTVENLALGIPTMCNISNEFYPPFNEFFGTTFDPFERVQSVQDIVDTLNKYSNMELLKIRSQEVRKFMEEHWSASYVVNKIVKKYEELLEAK